MGQRSARCSHQERRHAGIPRHGDSKYVAALIAVEPCHALFDGQEVFLMK